MEPFKTDSDRAIPRPPQMPAAAAATPPPMALAPPPQAQNITAVSEDDRTMGMLIHLLAMLTGLIGTLILWIVKKDESRFVDHHGKESLNFMISMLIYSFALMALSLVIGILTMGFGLIVLVPLYFVLAIGAWILEIMACMAAYRGEWHRYPFTIRLISH